MPTNACFTLGDRGSPRPLHAAAPWLPALLCCAACSSGDGATVLDGAPSLPSVDATPGEDGKVLSTEGGRQGDASRSETIGPEAIPPKMSDFAQYCTGTTLTDLEFYRLDPDSSEWLRYDAKLPAGTPILFAFYVAHWNPYVILADGTLGKLEQGIRTTLKKGVDYEEDCLPTSPGSDPPPDTPWVPLLPATFYDWHDSTGTPCNVPAGTPLSPWPNNTGTYQGTTIASEKLRELCGFSTGETKSIHIMMLHPRSG